MNTPIISPWFFYFAGIADGLGITLMVFGCIAILISIIVLCVSVDENETDFVKKSIKGIIISIVIIILGIFCPSEDTCYKMMLAKFATPQNIQTITEYVGDTASDVSDSVSDAIKDIMDYSVDRIYDIRNNQKVGDVK
nr:MAG TPA: hypothetical protein [Caudoviricetes sp.]